jgi:ferredoxin-NADP reductase
MEYARSQVLEAVQCGGETLTLRLSRPPGYDFRPGQYFMVRVVTAEGPQSKPFSLAAAPADPYLELTTRLSGSAFKNALAALGEGDPVEMSGPAGRFGVSEGMGEVVFLTGGVGITPVRSILRDAVARASGLVATLFFGNREEECIPYRAELDAMTGSGIHVVHVIQSPGPGWEGESGYITAEIVRRHADDLDHRTFVVSGPPLMVDAMTALLAELRVSPDRTVLERFSLSR